MHARRVQKSRTVHAFSILEVLLDFLGCRPPSHPLLSPPPQGGRNASSIAGAQCRRTVTGKLAGREKFQPQNRLVVSLALAALVALAPGIRHAATAGEPTHGLSSFGELKYGPDFKHFDYVNPNAPKGGRISMIGTEGRITFDSFNYFITKGDSAQGLLEVYDTLMVRAFDEPDAVYGLVARSATVAEDGLSVTFDLRPEAKFADGKPVTSEDVVFSFNAFKTKSDPRYRLALRDVVSAQALESHKVKYTFKGNSVRDLPLIVAAVLPVLPKHFYDNQPFDQTFLDPKPLGSGPYAVTKFRQGQFVTYRRRDDYWAKDLPVNVGRFNFDELRYEYFKDRTTELEGLKSGEFDLREEFTSRDWATAYDIPQVKSGRLQRLTFPDERPGGAQGFFINMRRDKFKDSRVREALDLAFDFEWTNKHLFYGLYKRTTSFFENSDLKADPGPPPPDELALLEPYRDQLPATVFQGAYVPPESNASGQDRNNLRKADKLLRAAGWATKGRARVNANGGAVQVGVSHLLKKL